MNTCAAFAVSHEHVQCSRSAPAGTGNLRGYRGDGKGWGQGMAGGWVEPRVQVHVCKHGA